MARCKAGRSSTLLPRYLENAMQLYSRRAVLAGLSALALPLSAVAAARPLKIVFPFAPGGSGDSIARLFAERLHGE